MSDQYGGFVCSPIMSDIQHEPTRDQLIQIGLSREDAEHISQAIANQCDYFLPKDEATIIKYRDQIRKRFFKKLRTPVELVVDFHSLARLRSPASGGQQN